MGGHYAFLFRKSFKMCIARTSVLGISVKIYFLEAVYLGVAFF